MSDIARNPDDIDLRQLLCAEGSWLSEGRVPQDEYLYSYLTKEQYFSGTGNAGVAGWPLSTIRAGRELAVQLAGTKAICLRAEAFGTERDLYEATFC